MFGSPSGENIVRISSSDNPAAWPSEISPSWSRMPGPNQRRVPWWLRDLISPFFS